MTEAERRELANQHRDEVVPGSGVAIEPWAIDETPRLPSLARGGVKLLREDSIVRVGVTVLIIDDAQENVLLLKRTGSHGAGTWSCPGGWMDFGESPLKTAHREVREELGIEVALSEYIVPWTNDVFDQEGKHCLTLWFKARITEGKPDIMEPNKATELRWVPLGGPFPEPLFLSLANVLKGF